MTDQIDYQNHRRSSDQNRRSNDQNRRSDDQDYQDERKRRGDERGYQKNGEPLERRASNKKDSEYSNIYRLSIVVLVGLIGFLARNSWEDQKDYNKTILTKNEKLFEQDKDILNALKDIKSNQKDFSRDFKSTVKAEYVSTHYIAVVANGKRVLLRRVYVSEDPNAKPDLTIFKDVGDKSIFDKSETYSTDLDLK